MKRSTSAAITTIAMVAALSACGTTDTPTAASSGTPQTTSAPGTTTSSAPPTSEPATSHYTIPEKASSLGVATCTETNDKQRGPGLPSIPTSTVEVWTATDGSMQFTATWTLDGAFPAGQTDLLASAYTNDPYPISGTLRLRLQDGQPQSVAVNHYNGNSFDVEAYAASINGQTTSITVPYTKDPANKFGLAAPKFTWRTEISGPTGTGSMRCGGGRTSQDLLEFDQHYPPS